MSTPSAEPNQLILLIHGLGGHRLRTWGKFKRLLSESVPNCDCETYGYNSGLFRLPFMKKYPKIQELAKELNDTLESKYSKYETITIMAHSLGGVVTLRYLLTKIKRRERVRIGGVLLFSVPVNGASLARLGGLLTWRHYQIRQLCKRSDFLDGLAEDLLAFELFKSVSITAIRGSHDRVVKKSDTICHFYSEIEEQIVPEADHTSVVKPKTESDTAFLIAKRALLGEGGLTEMEKGQLERNTMVAGIHGVLHEEKILVAEKPAVDTKTKEMSKETPDKDIALWDNLSAFFALPDEEKVEIFHDIGLITDEELPLSIEILSERAFERAKKKGLLPKIWEHMQGRGVR